MLLTGSLCFTRTVVASVEGLWPRCAGQSHSLEKGTVAVAQCRTHFDTDLRLRKFCGLRVALAVLILICRYMRYACYWQQ